MRRIKILIGRILYLFASHLPVSFFWINIGQKQIRAFCGKLILAKCGKCVNIEKGAEFSSSLCSSAAAVITVVMAAVSQAASVREVFQAVAAAFRAAAPGENFKKLSYFS